MASYSAAYCNRMRDDDLHGAALVLSLTDHLFIQIDCCLMVDVRGRARSAL